MADRPVNVSDQVPAERPGAGSRRKAVAFALAALVVVGGLVATSGGDGPDPAVQVNAAQPGGPAGGAVNGAIFPPHTAPTAPPPGFPTTTAPPRPEPTTSTTFPVASTSSTAPMGGPRTLVMAASDERWYLHRVTDGSRRCLELTVGDQVTGRLLCNAPAATGLWGRYAVVHTVIGRIVVAMVEPRITDLGATFGDGVFPQLAADPTGEPLHYAVGRIQNLGGGRPEQGFDLMLMEGENTLGRARISLEAGQYQSATVAKTAPYGFWAGYRKAGYTGFFWGGNEDVGFYDNPAGDGTRCVLWRRFGGPAEGVILDACLPATDAVFSFAELRTEPQSSDLVRPAFVVDTPYATQLTCSWEGRPDGNCPLMGARPMPDPAGSGRAFFGYFPGAFQRQGDRMTVTASDGTRTLAQITVEVQPPPFSG